VIIEDALMVNLADDSDVREVATTSPGQGGAELNEPPPAVVLGRDDQRRVGRGDFVEIFRCELLRDFRK